MRALEFKRTTYSDHDRTCWTCPKTLYRGSSAVVYVGDYPICLECAERIGRAAGLHDTTGDEGAAKGDEAGR